MTTTNDPVGRLHPEDLLASYALDTLPEGDAAQVESHLDVCTLCREEVAQLLGTTVFLSQAVEWQTPPPGLESRLMEALAKSRSQAVPPAPVASVLGFAFPWPKILAPAAAAVVVLLAASLVMNFRYFGQVGQLNEENSNLTARVLQFSTEDSKLLEFLQEEEMASYLLANPSNEPLMLEPPDGGGEQQGVLLLGEDSRHAILLVSGMPQESLPTSYYVWLFRSDQRVRMGQVQVDSSGWGTMSFYYPPESVLRFDELVLSRQDVSSGEAASRDMVLQGSFASLKSSK
ncbi:MAG: anti-sigma factor [Chloroflexi bacterium]|nr:anti-sigma factor [Chloroflexota bacterium]